MHLSLFNHNKRVYYISFSSTCVQLMYLWICFLCCAFVLHVFVSESCAKCYMCLWNTLSVLQRRVLYNNENRSLKTEASLFKAYVHFLSAISCFLLILFHLCFFFLYIPSCDRWYIYLLFVFSIVIDTQCV